MIVIPFLRSQESLMSICKSLIYLSGSEYTASWLKERKKYGILLTKAEKKSTAFTVILDVIHYKFYKTRIQGKLKKKKQKNPEALKQECI